MKKTRPEDRKVMTQLLAELKPACPTCECLSHRKTWLMFMETGRAPVSPAVLHRVVEEVVRRPENLPRGERLLHLEPRYRFTIHPDGRPDRPEEALERFLAVANPEGLFNQVPIKGGKESADIVLAGDGKAVFVELKPWASGNTPLYALIESLKNLATYRVLREKGIPTCNRFDQVSVAVLAPTQYYSAYSILDRLGLAPASGAARFQAFLEEVASASGACISILSLNLGHTAFLDQCRPLAQGCSSKKVVSAQGTSPLEPLRIANWRHLMTSGGEWRW